MNDADKTLEAELRSLQPQPPSASLKQRIANSLSRRLQAASSPLSPLGRWAGGDGVTRTRRLAIALSLLALATAACIALAILLPRPPHPESLAELPPAAELLLQQPVAAAFDETLPSLWSYRRALGQSADAADALLDKHSAQLHAQSPEDKPQRARITLFARFPSELPSLPGEL